MVLKKQESFIERLENPKNINFENRRLMIISPKFSDKQISEAKPNFELWQVSLYDDCHVEYKNLRTNETEKLTNLTKDDLKLTEEVLLKNKTAKICELYDTLKNCVQTEFSDLNVKS